MSRKRRALRAGMAAAWAVFVERSLADEPDEVLTVNNVTVDGVTVNGNASGVSVETGEVSDGTE